MKLKPLVVDVGGGVVVWVESGVGYQLRPGESWRPLDASVPGLGGDVLSAEQVAQLVWRAGRPEVSP